MLGFVMTGLFETSLNVMRRTQNVVGLSYSCTHTHVAYNMITREIYVKYNPAGSIV